MKVFAVLYSFFPDISSVKLTRCPLSWLILPQNVSTLQFLLQLGKILKSQLFPQVWGLSLCGEENYTYDTFIGCVLRYIAV